MKLNLNFRNPTILILTMVQYIPKNDQDVLAAKTAHTSSNSQNHNNLDNEIEFRKFAV